MGAYAAFHTTLLHIKILNKNESPMIVLLYILCFQRQLFVFLFHFTAAGVQRHVAAVKRLPVLHHIADYILIALRIIEPILVALKLMLNVVWRPYNSTRTSL